MATQLSDIQTLVRHEARDNNLDISTAGVALNNSNKIYRRLAGMLPWPEFRQTHTLTAKMETNTESYAWAFTGSPKFINIVSVEVETAEESSVFDICFVPPNEYEWNAAKKATSGIPRYYVRMDDGTNNSISLRPVPSSTQNDGDIKVTGYVEPTALASSSSSTEFATTSADDALVHLIAANWLLHDGTEQYAQIQIQLAQDILQNIFGKDQIPDELAKRLAQ